MRFGTSLQPTQKAAFRLFDSLRAPPFGFSIGYRGLIQLGNRDADPFHLVDLLPRRTSLIDPPLPQALVRERCRNVMFFWRRTTAGEVLVALKNLQQAPFTPRTRLTLSTILGEPHLSGCLASPPATAFDAVDRLTSMGRAEGGEAMLFLGFVAGSITLAHGEDGPLLQQPFRVLPKASRTSR